MVRVPRESQVESVLPFMILEVNIASLLLSVLLVETFQNEETQIPASQWQNIKVELYDEHMG